jgi:immune inhibitor A
VLVRFEYVTDDAVHRSGWLIDDVRIPELNYADDMESGPGGWEANGFVYSDNRVPQGYLVRLLTVGQTVSVHTLAVDESGYGRAEIRGLGTGINTAVLVVAAVAPATTETAPYRYSIQELR